MTSNHPSFLSISEFSYELPPHKIALYPLAERDQSKLLVYKQSHITEERFENLADCLPKHSLLIFNKTKVIRARLHFKNSKGQNIEIFCLEPHASAGEISQAMFVRKEVKWNCLVGNLKQWKDEFLELKKDALILQAKISEKQSNHLVISFTWMPHELSFSEVLAVFGNTPIPPYLNRKSEQIDEGRYQTIYAQQEGSVAAPTAGLHFTERVMNSLDAKGVKTVSLTLHVSAGTFKPVKAETMSGHEMHAERMNVDISEIQTLLSHSGNFIAVGTTSLRTLESLYWMGLKVHNNSNLSLSELEIKQWEVYDLSHYNYSTTQCLEALLAWMKKNQLEKLICQTAILIAPPYQLRVCDGLVTNFHQPQSTLLLLVSCLVGQKWREIYSYALEHDFRFLSYGDSSLLLK